MMWHRLPGCQPDDRRVGNPWRGCRDAARWLRWRRERARIRRARGSGRTVTITSPDKVFFPERGETKLDLVRYYQARRGAAAAGDRRPAGAHAALSRTAPSGTSFFQKRVPKSAPDWLQTAVVSTPNGTTSDALVAADLAHIVWAVNLGCLGFHVWPSRADDPDARRRAAHRPRPDARRRRSRMVREAAREVAGAARRARPRGLPEDDGQARHPRLRPAASRAGLATRCAGRGRGLRPRARAPPTRPDHRAWWKEERGERVFVDFNQNAPHKTVFGAWSVRARPGAQVSTPFAWDELDDDPPRRPHDRDGAGAGGGGRRPVGRHRRRAAVARAAARAARARPRRRAHGRAVAAGLSEDAERAAPRGAEPARASARPEEE